MPKTKALIPSEQLLITKLNSLGIPAYPGKAISHAHVDVVAWGIVNIEVKYSTIKQRGGYSFLTTPAQREHGFRAHVVVLICDPGDSPVTFHLVEANHPVFYIDEQMKHAITYDPRVTQHKHESNRVVLTKALMESAQDRWEMIEELRVQLAEALKRSSY